MSETIHHEVVLPAKPDRVYRALMDSAEHAAFTGTGAATISGETGGSFTTNGGMIEGRNIELVPGRRIVQAWRNTAWPSGYYSLVRFELTGDDGKTRLVFDHIGAPDDARAMLDRGWQERYWAGLRKYLA
jgi:uncharacterized protein YndB with AHSA1/START domain